MPSDPTVSRLISALACDAPRVLAAIDNVRAQARAPAWGHAGDYAPDHDISAQNPIVIDLDATLVAAHSEKEKAAPTYKRGFGFHPRLAFVDHGKSGTGEPVATLLRPGSAGSNAAVDHIEVTRKALAQLPFTTGQRPGRKVLVRTDGAGVSHTFLTSLHRQRVSYSIGFGLTDAMVTALAAVPENARYVAVDSEEKVHDDAWVIDARAQLRFTDPRKREVPPPAGLRLTAFATNTIGGQVQDLELRRRRRRAMRGPHPHRQGHRAD